MLKSIVLAGDVCPPALQRTPAGATLELKTAATLKPYWTGVAT
jgi:hypothetical protein